MRADLAHLFGVDLDAVQDGRVSARHALALLERAPIYKDSLIRREVLGEDAAEWDQATAAVAHVGDLIASLIAGFSKEQSASELMFKRPVSKRDADAEPALIARTLAEVNWSSLMGAVNGG